MQSLDSHSDDRVTGLHLVRVQSLLAPWLARHEEEGGAFPSPLNHGPLELLTSVLETACKPHVSSKLLEDALILLTYGATSYLPDHYDQSYANVSSRATLQTRTEIRRHCRQALITRATNIQDRWRTQRFHTNQLPPLTLAVVKDPLMADIQRLMAQEQAQEEDEEKRDEHAVVCMSEARGLMTHVPVELDERALREQVEQYNASLRERVSSRRHAQVNWQRQQLEDQRQQEGKKKRLAYQKKKRYENARRRWNYFATLLLRSTRGGDGDDADDEGQTPLSSSEALSPQVSNSGIGDTPSATTHSDSRNIDTQCGQVDMPPSRRLMRNVVHRRMIRRFVARVVLRGLSRVLCAASMDSDNEIQQQREQNVAPPVMLTGSSGEPKELRLGLLLCDSHFGAKYLGLYRRLFDHAARQDGRVGSIAWCLFDCTQSEFPTRAQQRALDGFLIASGPISGSVVASNKQRGSRQANTGSRLHQPWRRHLLRLIRTLYNGKQTRLGGLGLGHVILAEALGATIASSEWDDGWNLLDPVILESSKDRGVQSEGQRAQRQGIRYLHGEYVVSLGATTPRGISSWRSASNDFLSCFRDPWVLSIDGVPECNSFVFEVVHEFHDLNTLRWKRRLSLGLTGIPTDDALDSDDTHVRLERVLGLEEKKRRLQIQDAALPVANLFLRHFLAREISPNAADVRPPTATYIIGSLDGLGLDGSDLEQSIKQVCNAADGIELKVRMTADGHLVVLSTQLESHTLPAHAPCWHINPPSALSKSILESPRRKPNQISGLRLDELRDCQQKLGIASIRRDSGSSAGAGGRKSLRLPSISKWQSTTSPTFSDVVPASSATAPRKSITSGIRRESVTNVVGVITLSEALIQIRTHAEPPNSEGEYKQVFLRLGDEECRQTRGTIHMPTAQRRALLRGLLAAIRIGNLPSDRLVIVSRSASMLNYMRRQYVPSAFAKDCRHQTTAIISQQAQRIHKLAKWAACADIVILDADTLLLRSAGEILTILHDARALGLQVFVFRDGKTSTTACVPTQTGNHLLQRNVDSPQHRQSKRKSSFLKPEAKKRGSRIDAAQQQQLLLLTLSQWLGLNGVITSDVTPDCEISKTRSTDTSGLAHLLAEWQAKHVEQTPPFGSQNRGECKDTNRTEDGAFIIEGEDSLSDEYNGDDSPHECDSDDGSSFPIQEKEITTEMTMQWREHGVKNVLPTSFTPCRPLQPKDFTQLFRAGHRKNAASSVKRGMLNGGHGPRRDCLRSIGALRAVPHAPPLTQARFAIDSQAPVVPRHSVHVLRAIAPVPSFAPSYTKDSTTEATESTNLGTSLSSLWMGENEITRWGCSPR